MVVAHMTVGAGVILLNLAVGIWGLATWRRQVPTSTGLAQAIALSHTLALAQGAFGLYLLAGGYRAPARLHYVYGLLPAAAVAFGYSARTPDARRNLLQFAVIGLVIAAAGTRAFMTGRGM